MRSWESAHRGLRQIPAAEVEGRQVIGLSKHTSSACSSSASTAWRLCTRSRPGLGAGQWPRHRPFWLERLHSNFFSGRPGRVANGIGGLVLVLLAATGAVIWWLGRAGTLAPWHLAPGTLAPS